MPIGGIATNDTVTRIGKRRRSINFKINNNKETENFLVALDIFYHSIKFSILDPTQSIFCNKH